MQYGIANLLIISWPTKCLTLREQEDKLHKIDS